ncbi:MAG: cupredoxin domain-containing protein [Candidatus Berkelbacteria bacterium]|nr:cupredoxin domain-containing protein [Candidatus Berkelbacteria bacterium]
MKSTAISIIVSIVLIGGAVLLARGNSNPEADILVNNVSVVDGKQIIEIRAKGGYQPRKSIAKAGTPTILRFDTNGTFDCSSSVRIASLDISKILPQRGTTDVDIGVNQTGTLQGACSMGMYPFEIEFQD